MAFPQRRLRRLRRTPALRRLVAETRLSVARPRYIAAVQDFNVAVRKFPTNLTAMMFGYEVRPSFTVENEKAISTAPTVDFGAEKK